MENPCDKVKLCKNCAHSDKEYEDFWYRLVCRRIQTKKCDPVHGSIIYTGDYFDCKYERGDGKTFKEMIFGERSDKCGEEGKYWECKN